MRHNAAMSATPHLLIVDDDRELRQLLPQYLSGHGFRVDAVADGKAMSRILETGRFDLIVLDLMLPGEDGLALCRRLRASSRLPVIMLTALAEETDRIVGLEMGADDYVAKPFSPRELLARIKAVLRRTTDLTDRPEGDGHTLVFEGWRLDLARRELHSPEGVLMPLTGGEFDLLAAFAEHPRRVLSRDQLLDLTRGRSASAYDRSVDVQLSRLRRKIEADPNDPVLIKTVRGGGYLFAAQVDRQR
ncbi:response regulator [Methylococcus mesophilus]|nr:response regulator [Methylococcus mesophilus]